MTKEVIMEYQEEGHEFSKLKRKEEIIRCRDCQYWDTTWQNDYAPDHHYCSLVDGVRNGNFYCADAERKQQEQKQE